MKTITVIQPSKTEKKMLRVAAYCRVSSSSEDQLHSFKAQNAYYRTLIANTDGWTLADIYADEGITGTSAEKRPGFQHLMADCRKGKIDLVLAKSISRFARNTKDCIEALRELKKLNIAVRFEKEGIDTSNDSGEMLITMMSAMAQEESISISQNMRWSYQKRMQAGTFNTCYAPFGYSLVDGKLIVNESEAAIVRKIYRMFLSGMGVETIRKELNGRFSKWGIRYILTNEKYMGDVLAQKTYTTDTLPFMRVKNRGDVDQFYISDTHERIVSREDFYAVQTAFSIRSKIFQAAPIEKHWAAGKVFCGVCGSTFYRRIVREKVYWVCGKHYEDADLCSTRRIPEKELQRAFLNVCGKLKFGAAYVLEPMLCQLTKLREQSTDIQNIDSLKKEEYSLKEQNRLLADLQVKGHLDSALYAVRKQKILQRLEEIRQQTLTVQANDEVDERIRSTNRLIETISFLPESVSKFDEDIFRAIVINITVNDDTLSFRLINDMVVTEKIHLKERTKK